MSDRLAGIRRALTRVRMARTVGPASDEQADEALDAEIEGMLALLDEGQVRAALDDFDSPGSSPEAVAAFRASVMREWRSRHGLEE